MCDFIWDVYNNDLEDIIRKHYGDELFTSNPKLYEDCVLELKEHLENICKQAQEIIHV